MVARALYYDLSSPPAFSTLRKLAAASKAKSKRDIEAWLLKQDSYTAHRPVRKRFPRNPYNVTNVMDAWECNLTDVHSLRNYNDKYKCLLTVIYVFSKFLHIVRLRSKTNSRELCISSDPRNIRNLYADDRTGCGQIRAKNFWKEYSRTC